MKQTFFSLIQSGRDFHPHNDVPEVHHKLLPGAYFVKYNPQQGKLWFEEFRPTCDNIIDLPSLEYTRIVNQMKYFLMPETKSKFEDKGFLYKRSALLHGLPGTGKSIIINRVMREVINHKGVVLFVEDPRTLKMAFNILDDLQKELTTLVVFEEIDGIIQQYGESTLLSILDGEIQKENVMYLAATNYLDRIPTRLLRPGRFSSVIEVGYPSAEARRVYFEHKMGADFAELQSWVNATSGLSVDELKEVVQSVYIFNDNLQETVSRIKKIKGQPEKENDSDEWRDDDEDEDGFIKITNQDSNEDAFGSELYNSIVKK